MESLNTTRGPRKTVLAAAIVAASMAASQVHADAFELAPGFTLNGFVDMSYSVVDADDADKDENAGIDQVELQMHYDFGSGLTAHADVEWHDNGEGDEWHLEQAYIAYQGDSAFSGKAGRFLSYSGWETEDPTGLFQYSGTGYGKYFYGAYQQGVSGLYSGDWFTGAISLVTDIGNLQGDITDTENLAVEVMAAFTPTESITWKTFYMGQESDQNGEDIYIINSWASYTLGGFTFALEANISENTGAAVAIGGDEAEATGGLFMANYAWEKWGFTFRYHQSEVETKGGTSVEDITGYTFAPSYQIHPNLLLVAEYRMDEEDVTGVDTDSYAIEALLTW